MVKPLYPRPYNQNKNLQSKETNNTILFNPYIISIIVLISLGIIVTFYHFYLDRKQSKSGNINKNTSEQSTSLEDSSYKKEGWFSFLSPYKLIRSKNIEVFTEEETKLLSISTDSIQPQMLKAENYRDKRRIYAIQKYEITRQLGGERENQIESYFRSINSRVGNEIKDALTAAESADNLAIMKLEKIAEEYLKKQGASTAELDLLIYALQNLAEIYTQKNLKEKAKATYLSMFQLLKEKASNQDASNYDLAIAELEKLNTK